MSALIRAVLVSVKVVLVFLLAVMLVLLLEGVERSYMF